MRLKVDVDNLVGRTLAKRYRIVRPIGEGGMGVVFEAVHIALGRPVALKVLRETDERALERFRQEALATAKLDSPHIVGVTDFHASRSGPAFIVMELLTGISLRKVIQRDGVLGTQTAIRIADQLLSALATAHRAGIVHRDVKPPNILLVPDAPGAPPIVKLLDFGIAKLAAEAGGMKTTVGTVLGTPAYLAPEQIMGTEVDARTDVHAVGLVLREMLVGKRLWMDAQGAELGRAIALEVPPLITRSDVPAALAALIARALEKDPRARFVDAADMRSALRAIRVVEMGGAAPEGAEPRSPDTERDPEPATVRDADDALPTRRMAPRMAPRPKARPWNSLVQVVLVVIAAALGVLLAGGGDAWRAEPRVSAPPPSDSLASGEPAPAVMAGQVEPRPPPTGHGEIQPDARAPEPPRRAKPVKLPSAAIPSASVVIPSASVVIPSEVPSAPPPPALPPPSCPAAERDPFNGRCPAQ